MDCDARITQAIYTAIDEVNAMPGALEPIRKSPATALVGDGGELDSLSFVTFVAALEEAVEASFGRAIRLMDIAWDIDPGPCTVASLRGRIAEMLNGEAARETNLRAAAFD